MINLFTISIESPLLRQSKNRDLNFHAQNNLYLNRANILQEENTTGCCTISSLQVSQIESLDTMKERCFKYNQRSH